MNIVEKFGGISVPDWGDFRDFKSPQGKNFHRRNGTARADTRGGSGLRREELRQRNFSRDAWTSESRQLKRDSSFEQIRARSSYAGTYTAPKAAGAAEAAAESCDGGIDPARVLLIWVVR